MKSKLPDNYIIINGIFAGIILTVFLYSFIFGIGGLSHPIPSGSQILHQDKILSTGLSRSFSAMTHLNFHAALNLNPYGPQIFIFFLIQLFLRITGTIVYTHSNPVQRKTIIIADGTISALLFVVFFMPFVRQAAGLFFC